MERFELVGSYNGVICFAVVFQNDPGLSVIHLCNPSINKAITVPKSELQFSKVGFGFNPLCGHVDDYVVTNMKTFMDVDHAGSKENLPVVEMYSLRMNSWKMIGSLPQSWTGSWMDCNIIFREFICW
ncbi:hypothetical protein MLD38_017497 [Melastoma candidum]|uniref:Uncharacterized protein n=1 Tax=Melastoma candidum TaxID=119954 RepID=A0ACB9QS57_9MYRT|nr:hypothetical protein MLD38_017497 [Melastoma candidum]